MVKVMSGVKMSAKSSVGRLNVAQPGRQGSELSPEEHEAEIDAANTVAIVGRKVVTLDALEQDRLRPLQDRYLVVDEDPRSARPAHRDLLLDLARGGRGARRVVPVVGKHDGPGPHPGTGSPQAAHGGGKGGDPWSVQAGEAPIPEGSIRVYHYTWDLDPILEEGLQRSKAKGEDYGEPNVIWASTQEPSPDRPWVEFWIKPDEIGIGKPTTWDWEAPTDQDLRDYEAKKGNLTLLLDEVPPERFTAHNRNWYSTARYFDEDQSLYDEYITSDYWDKSNAKNPQLMDAVVAIRQRDNVTPRHVEKHYGPGPHAGTGTPQSVHGGPGASKSEARMLTALAVSDGGYTWDEDKHLLVMSGKAVSPYKQAEETYTVDYWSSNGVEIVKSYINRHRDILSQPDTHVGAWVDDGKVYLDVSVVKSTHEAAVAVAKEHDQLGYFDLDEFVTYYRQGDGSYVAT